MTFQSTHGLFDDATFPTTTREIIDNYGHREVRVIDEERTVGELMRIMGPESFESSEEAMFTLYAAFGTGAIGRQGYTDRDPEPPGTRGHEPISL